ncbi:NAD(P)/FAD-dependent oxidoreductase [Rhodovibrio salinarum]|uniref:FAD-dependent oxidoreductase n=1 Tax=Rhodovibrio salinarum TaxID=1087 RepID=A0A934UZP5_9PROT|nr:FAD-binding oxidoreductase [Rhodovibrio salinarum]MBK1697407.1 FAD-dependent oxidoreductase [Rhodovibrio salinarum]
MSAPAHIDSYYAATASPAPERPPLAGEVRADVCVVGGGFTGVTAALELAERGYKVVLLEGMRIGWGATGRNGGQASTGFNADIAKLRRWVGDAGARQLFDLAEESKRMIVERVARHAIDCDLVWSHFNAANKPRHLDELKSEAEVWSRFCGYDRTEIIERDRLTDWVDSDAYVGGMADFGSGHLHPLNYCLGLARAAEEAGVVLHENSQVTRLETDGAKPRAVTDRGAVEADYLLLCGNAYLGDLVPQIRSKVMPVGTYIGATHPLDPERAQRLLPTNASVCDSNFVLNYYRLSADRRLLFGGRVSYSSVMPPNLPKAMRGKILQVFPQLADQELEYCWGGFVAITPERTPHIGRLGNNVLFAQGFSGHGVALTGVVGRMLAETVRGQAERFDVMEKLPHTPFPGGKLLRTPLLAMGMLWYRMRDFLP